MNLLLRLRQIAMYIGKEDFKHSFWENGVAAVKMFPMFDGKLMSM
jgi:hypothetical protein